MKSENTARELIFKVLLNAKNSEGYVENPVSLCIEKLPKVKKCRITELLRDMEIRNAISIFRRGLSTNNGGKIIRIKILKKELPKDGRVFIRW